LSKATFTNKGIEMNATATLLNNHLTCFGARDLNGVLADYTSDSVFFTADGPLIGVKAIRPFFERLMAEFAHPGARFELTHQSVNGDHAYIVWNADTPDNRYELGTDTFVIKNGKIAIQSVAMKVTTKG
jgi:ketosteroid isomerase-like protein